MQYNVSLFILHSFEENESALGRFYYEDACLQPYFLENLMHGIFNKILDYLCVRDSYMPGDVILC